MGAGAAALLLLGVLLLGGSPASAALEARVVPPAPRQGVPNRFRMFSQQFEI